MSEEATIKIRRKRQWLVGWGTSFHVFVDNQKIATIKNDKEETFQLSSGNHSLLVKEGFYPLYKSKTIELKLCPGDVKCFDCGYLRPNWEVLQQGFLIPLWLWCLLVARPFSQFPELALLTPQPSWVQPALGLNVAWLVAWIFIMPIAARRLPGIAIYLSE